MVSEELQQRLEALADLVQRGVSVDDTRGNLVASSVHKGAVDPVRTRAILTREIPAEVARWQNTHLHGAAGAVRVPANPELGMQDRIAVPLRHHGWLVGHLWILEGTTELPAGLVASAEDAGADLARLLAAAQRGSAENRLMEQHAVELLLSGEHTDQRASSPVTSLRPPAAVVVATPEPVARGDTACTTGQANRLTEVLGDAVRDIGSTYGRRLGPLAVRDNFVTLPYSLGSGETGDPAVAAARLRQAVQRHLPAQLGGAVAAAGRSCADLADLAASERQARFAARVAALDPAMGPAVTWEHLGIFRSLADLSLHTATLEELFPEVLRLLRARNGTVMARSAEAFLDAAGSVRAAADVLHVHRASLYYRLERVETVSGLRLSAGHDRLTLHCGLKAARLAGAYEAGTSA